MEDRARGSSDRRVVSPGAVAGLEEQPGPALHAVWAASCSRATEWSSVKINIILNSFKNRVQLLGESLCA